MTYRDFWQPLTTLYPEAEAKAMARYVMELCFGLTMSDILLDRTDTLPAAELLDLQRRLLAGEPVQYVVGLADFGPRTFYVDSRVLIPRPETYELCEKVVEEYRSHDQSFSILDIGTGSGCIACTLAAELPAASVTAWDISSEALDVARKNAERNKVHVTFEQRDILTPPDDLHRWDVIVSNPPYVCEFEKESMKSNVVDYEPHLALFVPDSDPLCFYRAIARYAHQAVKPGGQVFVECNPLFHDQQSDMLMDEGGFGLSHTWPDQFDNYRIIRVCNKKR